MKNPVTTRIIWIIAIASVVLGTILYFIISDKPQAFIIKFSVFSGIASSIALLVTFIQFLSLTNIISQTNLEVKIATAKIQMITALSEISKAIKTVNEIKKFLKEENFIAAELRMQDIKPLIIQIKLDDSLIDKVNKEEFNASYTDFNIDLNNINNHIIDPTNLIDVVILNSNLEKLSTLLLEIEGSLKTNQ